MRLSSLGVATGSVCVVMSIAGCHKSSPATAESASAPAPSVPASLAEPGTSAVPSASALAAATPEPAASDTPAPSAVDKAPAVAAKTEPAKTEPAKTEAPAPSPAPTATATASVAQTPSAPPPPKQTVVRGTYIGATHFNLSIQAPSPVEVGKTGSAAIALVARSPFHCNDKYPYKFKLDPPDRAVSYPSTLVRGMSVNGTHAGMSVPFVGRQPGRTTISGTLYMSVCSAEQCVMDRRRLAVSVQIQ